MNLLEANFYKESDEAFPIFMQLSIIIIEMLVIASILFFMYKLYKKLNSIDVNIRKLVEKEEINNA